MSRLSPVSPLPGFPRKQGTMEWTTPQFEQISLNCEINSYANAEL
jgi:coenzyme PQQ precursor peptide PqqA